jgi:carbon monoxide dehydrogenase subunit G
MILDGEFTFRAPRSNVWTLLQDPDVMVKAMPGAQRLVSTGDGTYEGTIRIGVGPVTAAQWTLTVALHDRAEPASYGMKVESKGPLGFTRGSASVELVDEPDGTRMKYRADMQIGGKVAGIGQRLLDQVAKMLTKQGLEALSREMEVRLRLSAGAASASMGFATGTVVDGELVDDATEDAADANPESGDAPAADEATASADAAAPADAMEPMEDASTPGSACAPGVPEDAAPVADLDQELPPGTV